MALSVLQRASFLLQMSHSGTVHIPTLQNVSSSSQSLCLSNIGSCGYASNTNRFKRIIVVIKQTLALFAMFSHKGQDQDNKTKVSTIQLVDGLVAFWKKVGDKVLGCDRVHTKSDEIHEFVLLLLTISSIPSLVSLS